MLRGTAAQQAVRAVLDAVGPMLPADLDMEIVGTPRAWRLRSQHAAGEHWGIWDVSRSESGGLSVDSGGVVLFGIGSLIPGLPGRLDAKLNAISALEMIQEAVADATGAPWPGPGYEVRSRITGAEVILWFERDTDGHRIALPALLRTLFH